MQQCLTSHATSNRVGGCLPAIQRLPSSASPSSSSTEKTGGTTLREFITEAADALRLDYLVPCHGGVHCTVLDPSTLHETGQETLLGNASIIAGHFFWGVWRQLPRWSGGSADGGEGETVPPCLVMARHPVDRAISYYYQRCYNTAQCIGYQRRINDLAADELLLIGRQERNGQFSPQDPSNRTIIILDEGMADAACRAVTGRRATSGIKYSLDGGETGGGAEDDGGLRVQGSGVSVPPPLDSQVLGEAKENVVKCVVGLQERWEETQAVIDYWFPWIGVAHDPGSGKCSCTQAKRTATPSVQTFGRCWKI